MKGVIFFLLNAAFAMAILGLISRVHLGSFCYVAPTVEIFHIIHLYITVVTAKQFAVNTTNISCIDPNKMPPLFVFLSFFFNYRHAIKY